MPRTLPAYRATGRYRYLLLLRYLIINATGALLGAIWVQGWIGQIVAADDTGICRLIFGLFLLGLFWTGQGVLMLSRENQRARPRPHGRPEPCRHLPRRQPGPRSTARTALATALRLKLAHRIAPVRHLASTLVLLGLIGTIIGFIIALSGVDPAAVTEGLRDRSHGRHPAARHVHGPVQDPGRLGAQCLADGQLSPARIRHHPSSGPGWSRPESVMRLPEGDDEGSDDSDIVFRDLHHAHPLRLRHRRRAAAAHIGQPRARSVEDRAPPVNVIVEANWPRTWTPASTSGCRRRVTCRWATPARVGPSSTCCATIWDPARRLGAQL
ncbi:MAG: hypothetical protein U1E17_07915 [Geminicoccaceae bacterium]